jgi:hypothetical protein
MDVNTFWQGLGEYKPSPSQVQYALAVLADAYSSQREQLIDLSVFKS